MNFAELIARHDDNLSPIFNPGLDWQNTIPIDLSTRNPEFDPDGYGLNRMNLDLTHINLDLCRILSGS